MSLLRVGILGCGGYAHRHAQLIQALPQEAQLVAFADRNLDRAQAFAAQYTAGQAQVFTQHRAMLDAAALDVLVIAVPPYGHSDEVQAAAERGVHLLIEKPIALSSSQAWEMVAAAEEAGIKTQVGFMFRFGAAVEHLRHLLDSGAAGPVALMTARYFCNALHADWWRQREKSGGQLFEQAIHLFDLMRYFMGPALAVYSRQENLFHQDVADYSIEDVSATIVSFASGGLGMVAATNAAIPDRWLHDYRVVAQHYTVDFTSPNHASFTPTQQPDQEPVQIASERDFRLHLTLDLLRAVRSGGDTRVPIREGALSLELVEAAVRSNTARGEIRL